MADTIPDLDVYQRAFDGEIQARNALSGVLSWLYGIPGLAFVVNDVRWINLCIICCVLILVAHALDQKLSTVGVVWALIYGLNGLFGVFFFSVAVTFLLVLLVSPDKRLRLLALIGTVLSHNAGFIFVLLFFIAELLVSKPFQTREVGRLLRDVLLLFFGFAFLLVGVRETPLFNILGYDIRYPNSDFVFPLVLNLIVLFFCFLYLLFSSNQMGSLQRFYLVLLIFGLAGLFVGFNYHLLSRVASVISIFFFLVLGGRLGGVESPNRLDERWWVSWMNILITIMCVAYVFRPANIENLLQVTFL